MREWLPITSGTWAKCTFPLNVRFGCGVRLSLEGALAAFVSGKCGGLGAGALGLRLQMWVQRT